MTFLGWFLRYTAKTTDAEEATRGLLEAARQGVPVQGPQVSGDDKFIRAKSSSSLEQDGLHPTVGDPHARARLKPKSKWSWVHPPTLRHL